MKEEDVEELSIDAQMLHRSLERLLNHLGYECVCDDNYLCPFCEADSAVDQTRYLKQPKVL